MEKFIKIRFSNGEVYEIPADFIASERTNYYATEVDGFTKDSAEWFEEYEFSLNNNYELEDWLTNNMNWSDIKDQAVLIKDETDYNYDDEFFEAEIDVVEH
jgi:hypothetical protein